VLPAAIAEFRKRHPLVELALFEGTSETVSQWVEHGRVEFGAVQLPAGGVGFEEELLFSEPFVLLAPRGEFLAGTRNVELASLSLKPFILYKGRARDAALSACRAAGFEPRIACESSELETIRSLVAAGLGVALLPKLATRVKTAGCVALPLAGTKLERQVALLSRAGQTPSPGATVFREILRNSKLSQ
jgi:DNA-binding transcriptional LysR family regulator